jgi:hypothetical protein
MDSLEEKELMRREFFPSWLPLYTINIKKRLKRD